MYGLDFNVIFFFLNQVWIFCNDCGLNMNVWFYLIVYKCSSCGLYNIRKMQRGFNIYFCFLGVFQVVGLIGQLKFELELVWCLNFLREIIYVFF